MFLQRTISKREGKVYATFLVRESFRTPKGPRARTVCNITNLPEDVRDLVGHALRGKMCVPTETIEVRNVQNCGGFVVLEDAWRRFEFERALQPLTPRSRALIKAEVFARVLFPPSNVPLADLARGSHLAEWCGLDPAHERFPEDQAQAAATDLRRCWREIEPGFSAPEPAHAKNGKRLLHLDAGTGMFTININGADAPRGAVITLGPEGLPSQLQLAPPDHSQEWLRANVQPGTMGKKEAHRTVVADEAVLSKLCAGRQRKPAFSFVMPVAGATRDAILAELDRTQLSEVLRRPNEVELQSHGKRYVLFPFRPRPAFDERMFEASSQPGSSHAKKADSLHALHTNLAREALSAHSAARLCRQFLAIQEEFDSVTTSYRTSHLETGTYAWCSSAEVGVLAAWLLSRLRIEWMELLDDVLPAKEIIRELQSIFRFTITSEQRIVRRHVYEINPSAATLVSALKLAPLFH